MPRPDFQPAQGQLTIGGRQRAFMLANFFVPVLGDGWRFIALFAGVTFLGALTGVAWLFWPLMVLTLWSIYFFRDPPRGVPQDDGVLVAPADGLVPMIVDAVPPAELPGKSLNAAADKASEENERMAVALRRPDGRVIGCVQIAGWVARRIVCYIKPGQAVAAGERFGHIRFGSRTDLYLPQGARLLVAAGQRMIGGETVMAELDPVVATPRAAIEF